MNRKILTLTMILTALPLAANGASVYKWTDENGVTHFGDREPTGKASEKVSVRTGTSSTGQSRPTPQERVEELESRLSEESAREAESAAEEARRKQRAANCDTARSNLAIMDRNSRIRIEEDGEQRYLSPEEIEEQRQKYQEIADTNCGPEGGSTSDR